MAKNKLLEQKKIFIAVVLGVMPALTQRTPPTNSPFHRAASDGPATQRTKNSFGIRTGLQNKKMVPLGNLIHNTSHGQKVLAQII